MKRVNNLYDKIAEKENLELAFYRAQRGKEWKEEVRIFRKKLDDELEELRKTIVDNTVEVGNYHYFKIHDPIKRL